MAARAGEAGLPGEKIVRRPALFARFEGEPEILFREHTQDPPAQKCAHDGPPPLDTRPVIRGRDAEPDLSLPIFETVPHALLVNRGFQAWCDLAWRTFTRRGAAEAESKLVKTALGT